MPADEHVSPPGQGLTVVTVTFRAEDELQRLQARSFARYAAGHVVDRVIVLDNGTPRLSAGAKRDLLADYGPLRDRVEIVDAADVVDLPSASGWMGQQVLKLTVASRVTTPLYVLLDAKNHLVRPLVREDFVGPDGRARGGFHSYAGHPLRPRLTTVAEYLGVDAEVASSWFPPTSTPFVMYTDVARAIVADIESTAGAPFAEEFVRADLSEFFLYSAWLLRRDGGWAQTYDGVAIQSPTVWGGGADRAGVHAAIAHVRETDAAFFAVHRRALGRLDRGALVPLEKFWIERELMTDARSFRRFVWRFRRDLAFSLARSRVLDRLRRR